MRQCQTSNIAEMEGSRAIDLAGYESGTIGSATCVFQTCCRSAMRRSTYTFMQTSAEVTTCGGTCAAKSRDRQVLRERSGALGTIKNHRGINERPGIVDQKSHIGDRVGNAVIGKNHRGALVTLAERKSRYLLAAQVPGQTCAGLDGSSNAAIAPP